MKAALFYGGTDIRVEEVPDPVPGPGEVVVRVRAAGICGSDLHGYRNASQTGRSQPSMRGHELAGEVAALGPGVTGLEVGQRVGVEPRHLTGCGRCRWCRRGDYHLCPALGRIGERLVHSTGFAECSLESADKCYPLPDHLSFEEAAILDVYAVAVHAIHCVPVRPPDVVVVLGTGPIGLATVQMARAAGAGRIIAVGRREPPLALARQMGCDATINTTTDDLREAVRQQTDGAGADVVLEAVGGRSDTLARAVEIVAPGGRVGIMGAFVEPQTVDVRACMRHEVTLHWVWSYSTWDGVPEFQIALHSLSGGGYPTQSAGHPPEKPGRLDRIDASPLITHRFPLERIGEAFAAAEDKGVSGAIKVLVIP